MSEMTAKEYAKQYKRMHMEYRGKGKDCRLCPFFEKSFHCDTALIEKDDKAIELVSKWAEEHPERTTENLEKAEIWKKMKMDSDIQIIAIHFGKEAQTKKAIEELSELIRALARGDTDNIIEECADVMLMIRQIECHYQIPEGKIKEKMLEKIKRTLERIEEAKADDIFSEIEKICNEIDEPQSARTYRDDFFDKYPNARKQGNGNPTIDYCDVCVDAMYNCPFDCEECAAWNERMEE